MQVCFEINAFHIAAFAQLILLTAYRFVRFQFCGIEVNATLCTQVFRERIDQQGLQRNAADGAI